MSVSGVDQLVDRQPHKLEDTGSIPVPALFLDSIADEESDPWRVLVTVCTVDGSFVDAARGSTATATAMRKRGDN